MTIKIRPLIAVGLRKMHRRGGTTKHRLWNLDKTYSGLKNKG